MSTFGFTPTDDRTEKLATQYRESPNLQSVIRTYLDSAGEVAPVICSVFEVDIDTSTGDQLTQIGKILGWGREQCGGTRPKVFGFTCEDECSSLETPIGGFCDNWVGDDCDNNSLFGAFSFEDDELYRRFLKSVVLKYDNDYRRSTLKQALAILFGEDSVVYTETPGTISISSGRALTSDEISIAHLFKQVLPIAPGVGVDIYETQTSKPFGFGEGWGGFCTGEFPAPVYKES